MLFTFPRRSRPLSDQGKWATGTTKKLVVHVSKISRLEIYCGSYLLDESAIPAKALYQARNAARIPKPPPALIAVVFVAAAPVALTEWSR